MSILKTSFFNPASGTPRLSQAAHGLIGALFLSVPFGMRGFAWLALLGSVLGWWFLATHPRRADAPAAEAQAVRFFKGWALACLVYVLLHAAQVRSWEEVRRMDAPVRVLLCSGVALLPLLAGRSLASYLPCLALSGVFFGSISIYQHLTSQDERIFGFYIYYNLMALTAVINAALILWPLNRKAPVGLIGLCFAGLFGCITACFLSGTRAAWVIIFLLIIFYLAFHREKTLFNKHNLYWAIGLTLVLSTIYFDSFSLRLVNTIEDMSNISKGDQSGSIGLRLTMVEMAWQKIKLHPLIGNGLGDFNRDIVAWANQNNLPDWAMQRGFQNSHNQYLHWAQSLGIPAALACAAILLVWPLVKAHRSEGANRQIVWIFVLVSGFFFLSEAVLDRYHGSTWYIVILSLLMGFLIAPHPEKTSGRRLDPR